MIGILYLVSENTVIRRNQNLIQTVLTRILMSSTLVYEHSFEEIKLEIVYSLSFNDFKLKTVNLLSFEDIKLETVNSLSFNDFKPKT